MTPSNLNKYILPDYPLHEAYPYLSETHKADYLRCYFMHHYGGGYTDIKPTTKSWIPSFDKLNNSDKYAIGYQEIKGGVCSNNPIVVQKYDELIGNGAYIFKPYTPITYEWREKTDKILDDKLHLLKKMKLIAVKSKNQNL